MKIFFVGVFGLSSSNYSHASIIERLNHTVYRFSYRAIAQLVGREARDRRLIKEVEDWKPDFVLISKGNTITGETVRELKKICPVVLWYMDSTIPGSWTPDLEDKMREASVVFCEKLSALRRARTFNEHSFRAIEGFDPHVDKPVDVKQDINISFIGSYYGKRKQLCEAVCAQKLTAYHTDHAIAVSRSRITLNFCTEGTVSDRLYKVLGAGGFIITDDWEGREFEDEKHLVLFDGSVRDLQNKTIWYLTHKEERETIAKAGNLAVQGINKYHWFDTIVWQLEELKLI